MQRVEISSAAVASMLSGVSSCSGHSDGLLFGRVHRRFLTQLTDDGGEEEIEDVAAVITGCCCTGTLMSFYNAAGEVDPRSLEALVGNREKWGGDPLIGWLSGRRNTPMRPSMREVAVSASLISPPTAAEYSLPIPYSDSEDNSDSEASMTATSSSDTAPCLFFLLSEFEADTIHTHEYRAFEYCGKGGMQPISVLVRNIGQQEQPQHQDSSSGHYGAFFPVAPLPWLSTSFSEVDSWKRSCEELMRDEQQDQALLHMFTDGMELRDLNLIASNGGVQSVEAIYRSILTKFENLAREARQSSAAVQEQEYDMQLRSSLVSGGRL